jgi:hypothetical protein
MNCKHNFGFVGNGAVKNLIASSVEGKNTKFLATADSLWFRFGNYQKSPPFAYLVENQIVCLIFATFNKDKYANLYEIVTVQGCEGKGYASTCWDAWIAYAVNIKKTERLKMSCTPSSVTWHYKNGLIWWAVDPTGSLRSDQKLFSTRTEQLAYRNFAITNPIQALPAQKIRAQFVKESLESYGWGLQKKTKTEKAIQAVGKAWLRPALFLNK